MIMHQLQYNKAIFSCREERKSRGRNAPAAVTYNCLLIAKLVFGVSHLDGRRLQPGGQTLFKSFVGVVFHTDVV